MRIRARWAYAADWTLWTLICVEALGFRINTTNSMPVGVWRLSPLAGALQRGEVVTVCLPDGPEARLAAERGYVPRPAPATTGVSRSSSRSQRWPATWCASRRPALP